MDTKCKIVPLDMVGRTENGTVYFSADEITVFFQFIGVNHFGFGQKKTLKHNRQSTVGTSAHFNPNRSLEKASCHFLMTAIRKTALYMLDS